MTRQLSRRKVVLSMVTKFDSIQSKDPRASQGYADINGYGWPKELIQDQMLVLKIRPRTTKWIV